MSDARITELEKQMASVWRETTSAAQYSRANRDRIEELERLVDNAQHLLSLTVGRMMITDPQWGARIDIMMLAQKGKITAERAAELVAELEGGPFE